MTLTQRGGEGFGGFTFVYRLFIGSAEGTYLGGLAVFP